jgi:hypothetical protein
MDQWRALLNGSDSSGSIKGGEFLDLLNDFFM